MTATGEQADGIVYVGHATTLVELDGRRLLTDPVLGHRIAHISRRVPDPDDAQLDRLDAILVSHAHYDHLDVPSLRRVAAGKRLVVPRGVGRLLSRRGIAATDEVLTGDTLTIGPLEVSVVHAEHDGRRWPGGTRYPSVGYVVQGGGLRVYFAGDTDLFEGMRELREIDVALLPICGWGVRVGPGHLNAQRAAEAVARIGPRIVMPIHWGTLASPSYAATDLAEPARRFAELTARAAPDVEVVVVQPGGRLELGLRARG